MKSLCITGAMQEDLELVASTFAQAGMEIVKAARHDPKLTMAFWHRQVLAANFEQTKALSSIDAPGRLWEQLATEVFLTNIDAPVCGWAESDSIWLLDFWAQFDPHIKFVLVTTTPERMVAQLVRSANDIATVGKIVDDWSKRHQLLLQFFHRNPQRCLLLDAAQCLQQRSALVEACRSRWQLPLNAAQLEDLPVNEEERVAGFLAQQICASYPQTAELRNELSASICALAPGQTAADPWIRIPIEQAVSDYRKLQDRSEELEKQRVLVARLQTVESENQQLTSSLQQSSANAQKLEAELSRNQQANELLLEQVQQVQEELKNQYLENNSLGSRLAEADKKLNEHNHRLTEADKKIEEHKHRLTEADKKIEEYKHQLANANKNIEEHIRVAHEHKQHISEQQKHLAHLNQSKAALEKTIEQLSHDKKQQADAAADLQKQIPLLNERIEKLQQEAQTFAKRRGELEKLNQQLTKAKQEGEHEAKLLMMQLHQVQEELESYFLKNQEQQKQLKAGEERWKRMLQRYPDYCDYRSIDVAQKNADDPSTLVWSIADLDAAGRINEKVEIETSVYGGELELRLNRQGSADTPLNRWPCAAMNDACIVFPPISKLAHDPKAIATILDLGPSDCKFMLVVLKQLFKLLESAAMQQSIGSADLLRALQTGLAQWLEAIEKLAVTLRYDNVYLKREQVNPDYEHLWLTFEQISFNGKECANFDFRLACAQVRPGHFGTHPKLEFPPVENCALLDSWYEESYDDFGGKLELRFALPNAMDLGVWQNLSSHDQAFIGSLLGRLPDILAAMQQKNSSIRRAWEDWTAMAKDMQRIYAYCINAAAQQSAAAEPTATPQAGSAKSVGTGPKKPAKSAPVLRRTR
ncbi:hypothetical protein [Methylomonas sp. HYX-M1]|uniref:hypothetical protein n=1 Tax=Methylomonas sp. HYX-M1 TaxID=3139307 RepID=UPI00345BBC95